MIIAFLVIGAWALAAVRVSYAFSDGTHKLNFSTPINRNNPINTTDYLSPLPRRLRFVSNPVFLPLPPFASTVYARFSLDQCAFPIVCISNKFPSYSISGSSVSIFCDDSNLKTNSALLFETGPLTVGSGLDQQLQQILSAQAVAVTPSASGQGFIMVYCPVSDPASSFRVDFQASITTASQPTTLSLDMATSESYFEVVEVPPSSAFVWIAANISFPVVFSAADDIREPIPIQLRILFANGSSVQLGHLIRVQARQNRDWRGGCAQRHLR